MNAKSSFFFATILALSLLVPTLSAAEEGAPHDAPLVEMAIFFESGEIERYQQGEAIEIEVGGALADCFLEEVILLKEDGQHLFATTLLTSGDGETYQIPAGVVTDVEPLEVELEGEGASYLLSLPVEPSLGDVLVFRFAETLDS